MTAVSTALLGGSLPHAMVVGASTERNSVQRRARTTAFLISATGFPFCTRVVRSGTGAAFFVQPQVLLSGGRGALENCGGCAAVGTASKVPNQGSRAVLEDKRALSDPQYLWEV